MTEWLTFITTLILAGITLWYVLLTRQMVKINQEVLKVSTTPEIRMFLTMRNRTLKVSTLDLCIENIGTGFAFDVEFSGNFKDFPIQYTDDTIADWDIIKNGISHLGPDKRYQIPVYYDYKPEDMPEKILTANVTYENPVKNKQRKTFHINFKNIESYPQIGNISIENIAETLLFIENNIRVKNAGTDKENANAQKPNPNPR